jgi:signal transduction histidine kinase/streptogramin lyase
MRCSLRRTRFPRIQLARALPFAGALIALAPSALAQANRPAPEAYRAKGWSTASGLPQNTINDIVQVRSGELWIATFAGLARFDGFDFRVFDLETFPELPSNRFTALAPDGDDGLWAATQAGDLVHVRGGRVSEVERTPEADVEVLALARANDGSVWTQASNGSVRRFDAGRWTTVVPRGSEGRYEGLCAHPDGTIGVAVGERFEIRAASGERLAELHAPSPIHSLAPRSSGGYWIGLADGLAIADGRAIERVAIDLPATEPVTAIVELGANDLWLGTHGGPAHVRVEENGATSANAVVSSEEALPPGFDVRSFACDREGDVWIGSNGQGLVRLRPQRVQSFEFAANGGNLCALADDGAGGAWLALECAGLAHLAAGSREPRLEPIDVDAPHVGCARSLLFDRSGRTWLGEDDRVLRRAAGTANKFEPILGARRFSSTIAAMVEVPVEAKAQRAAETHDAQPNAEHSWTVESRRAESRDSRSRDDASDAGVASTVHGDVWIATRSGALTRVGPGDTVLEEVDIGAPIIALAAATDGSLWIGGTNLVAHLCDGRVERFGAEANVARGGVRDLLPEPDGSVWLASYGGGLGRLRNGRATWWSRASGLPDNSLSCIRDDGRGRLWLLANLGLVVIDRADLDDVAAGRRPRIDPVVLGPEAGVLESSFGSPAGFIDARGRLWFTTIAGAVRVDASEFPFNRVPPHARIERIDADDLPLAIGDALRIRAGTRRLVIQFTAFALSAPERVRFRYRMEPFDEDWIDVGAERHAAFTALAPGDYTFRVAARNEDGVWSTEPTSMRIEVLPRWWETLAFRLGAAIAAALSLLALHRFRVATIRKRGAVLLQATEGRARAEERESRMREALAHAGRVTTAGELATSLAHEVNQPLAAIVANAQAGRRFLGRDDLSRGELDEILRDIAQQGQRASDVIRRLREFLRKRAAARRTLDVNQVVRDTLPLVRRELEDNRVDVALDLAAEIPAISADPVEMQQVLVNLVKNACEAMSAHEGERRVELSTSAHDGRVRVDVRDTGPGLAPEVKRRLFEPYVTTKDSGMGLGLPICRSIVEAHGGTLSQHEAEGGGVVFSVELPAEIVSEVAR